MSVLEIVALLGAGLVAGTINTVVGSGSLVTFSALLAFGYSPVTANISNNMGVLPGSFSGALAYRRELIGQWARALRLAAFSVVGGLAGALLLLWLPASAFDAIVPVLIVLACVLIVLQPWLQRRLLARRPDGAGGGIGLRGGVLFTGMYGGYFGAAQGVLLMGLLGIAIPEDLQRLNALKNVLAAAANGAAAAVFLVRGGMAWEAVAVIAVGSTIGAQLGAPLGRRLPPPVYRTVIVIVGLIVVARLILL